MEDAVEELRTRGIPPGRNIGGRSKAPHQQQLDMLRKEGDRIADFVVKILSSLWWCCSTTTCATFGSDAELTEAVQSV